MILGDAKAVLDKQNDKGLRKYGGPLDATNLSAMELIDHAIEEAADQLMYLVALKSRLAAEQSSSLKAEDQTND